MILKTGKFIPANNKNYGHYDNVHTSHRLLSTTILAIFFFALYIKANQLVDPSVYTRKCSFPLNFYKHKTKHIHGIYTPLAEITLSAKQVQTDIFAESK